VPEVEPMMTMMAADAPGPPSPSLRPRPLPASAQAAAAELERRDRALEAQLQSLGWQQQGGGGRSLRPPPPDGDGGGGGGHAPRRQPPPLVQHIHRHALASQAAGAGPGHSGGAAALPRWEAGSSLPPGGGAPQRDIDYQRHRRSAPPPAGDGLSLERLERLAAMHEASARPYAASY
jgi:hypothetical protein